jgi:hypothetical protein
MTGAPLASACWQNHSRCVGCRREAAQSNPADNPPPARLIYLPSTRCTAGGLSRTFGFAFRRARFGPFPRSLRNLHSSPPRQRPAPSDSPPRSKMNHSILSHAAVTCGGSPGTKFDRLPRTNAGLTKHCARKKWASLLLASSPCTVGPPLRILFIGSRF